MGVSRTEEAETSNVLCTEYLVSRILSGLQFFDLNASYSLQVIKKRCTRCPNIYLITRAYDTTLKP